MSTEQVPFWIYRDKQWDCLGWMDKSVWDYLEETERKKKEVSDILGHTSLEEPATFDEALERARTAAKVLRDRRKKDV